MSHGHLVRKNAHIAILGQPLILVKNQKLIICLFLDKMDIKIMFDDHLVKEQALLGKKNIDFT